MEFPKPSTPEHEKIVVCDHCYRNVKTWEVLKASWEAEEVRLQIVRQP
jgi:hypothetical protein